MKVVLRLTLIDELVLSERSATLGGHRGLDYIPGAALLGAAAQRLYGKLATGPCLAGLPFRQGPVRRWPATDRSWRRRAADAGLLAL